MRPPLTENVKYVPSLDQMIGQCTVNYVQLLKLFPDIRQYQKDDQKTFHLCHEQHAVVTCTVTEAAPYTTFLTFTQMPRPGRERQVCGGRLLALAVLSLTLRVRLYHDAQLAEVVDAAQGAMLPGRFSYPNPRMFHTDEKAQSNRFLGEWLAYCRKHGLAISSEGDIYY